MTAGTACELAPYKKYTLDDKSKATAQKNLLKKPVQQTLHKFSCVKFWRKFVQILAQKCAQTCSEYICVLFGRKNLYKKKNLRKKACQTCKFLVKVSWACVRGISSGVARERGRTTPGAIRKGQQKWGDKGHQESLAPSHEFGGGNCSSPRAPITHATPLDIDHTPLLWFAVDLL